jgi:hypothetical protein
MRSSPRVCRVWAENGTTLSVTTRDVVKVAHHASLANKLDISQSNGSILLEQMRLLSRATIQGRGGDQFGEGMNGAKASVKT